MLRAGKTLEEEQRARDDRPDCPLKVLVTGGAGFIGSHLAERLVAERHSVGIVDSLARGNRRNLRTSAFGGARLYPIDIRAPELRDVVLTEQPEVVFHLAAHVDVRASIANPLGNADVNVLGTLNLLEASRLAGVRKVVLASDVAPAPSPHGIAKRILHEYLRFYQDVHGLDWTVLALSSVYGPREDPLGSAGVVARFLGALLTDGAATIYGSGDQMRDFLYVADAVDAMVASLDRGGASVLDVGTGTGTSILQLWQRCAAAAQYFRDPTHGPRRPCDPPRIVVDPEPARVALEWTPSWDLDNGLTETARWMRAHTQLRAAPVPRNLGVHSLYARTRVRER